jgi:hypothetical protein
MKKLWIPLVAVIVLLAASTASAGWTYTSVTGWTYFGPPLPAPTVHYHASAPYYHTPAPVVVPRPPLVLAPRVIAPLPVFAPAPVFRPAPIGPRVLLRRPILRRRVWVW